MTISRSERISETRHRFATISRFEDSIVNGAWNGERKRKKRKGDLLLEEKRRRPPTCLKMCIALGRSGTRESAGRCGQPWCGVGGTAVGPRISQGSGLHSSSLFHDSIPPPFQLRKGGCSTSAASAVSFTGSPLFLLLFLDTRYVRSGNASMSCLRNRRSLTLEVAAGDPVVIS